MSYAGKNRCSWFTSGVIVLFQNTLLIGTAAFVLEIYCDTPGELVGERVIIGASLLLVNSQLFQLQRKNEFPLSGNILVRRACDKTASHFNYKKGKHSVHDKRYSVFH